MDLSNLVKQQCLLATQQAFATKVADLDPNLLEVTEATQEKFGHYQLNSAMKLGKVLGENPRQIAEKIVLALKEAPDFATLFSKVEIAGPGFINFTLNTNFITKTIRHQLQDPYLGLKPHSNPSKVIIDFSSPNVAKEITPVSIEVELKQSYLDYAMRI